MSGARIVAAAAVAVFVAGCSSGNAGLSYDQLGIEATHQDGSAIAGFNAACVTLPLLDGSIVEETHTIEGPLKVKTRATPDAVEVEFIGAASAAGDQRVTLDQLRAGFSDDVQVDADGASYAVTLMSGCSN